MSSGELRTVVCNNGGTLKELHKSETSGQVTMRTFHPGESSSGALHRGKDEKWWVALGQAVIKLEFPDGMREMLSIDGAASRIISVPAGTGHQIRNCGEEDMVLVFHSSEVYDPDNPDREDWTWE